MKIKPTHLSYISGVVDSEGCICISKSHAENRLRYNISLSIAMNDQAALTLMQKYFGGNITIGNGKRKDGHIRHDCYVLRYSTQKTKEILTKILPYLQVKTQQAKIALEFIKVRQSFNKMRQKNNHFAYLPHHIESKYEKLYEKCRSLKKHYWMPRLQHN